MSQFFGIGFILALGVGLFIGGVFIIGTLMCIANKRCRRWITR